MFVINEKDRLPAVSPMESRTTAIVQIQYFPGVANVNSVVRVSQNEILPNQVSKNSFARGQLCYTLFADVRIPNSTGFVNQIMKRTVYPTTTTSIKNVGLSEPERSGAEHTPATLGNLSPL